MTLDDVPIFAMLKSRLGYLADRQKLIAENVANADTPGFAPHDLKPFSFAAKLAGQGPEPPMPPDVMATTAPGHMTPPGAGALHVAAKVAAKDSETTLDGNSVVLEEEMMKMGQARIDYDTAITFYQKALAMIRTAARAPGHG